MKICHGFRAAAVSVLLACSAFVSTVVAQQKPEPRTDAAPIEVARPIDAESTRQALMQILQKHPPSVGRVLKLDPSLMRNESYLTTYPSLRDFLAEHPEIPQNAPYYLESIRGVGFDDNWRRMTPQQELLQGVLAGLAVLVGFSIAIGTAIWLVRTTLEQRRWNRLSKIQAEVHTKLMDRFSSNDELMSYVQTPSGRRFLESGPSPLQEAAPSVGAPFSRILWSVQLGAVLLVSGLGLLFLSSRAPEETREVFYVMGCMASVVGAGFVVSAAAAYALSRRLGLLDRPVQNNA